MRSLRSRCVNATLAFVTTLRVAVRAATRRMAHEAHAANYDDDETRATHGEREARRESRRGTASPPSRLYFTVFYNNKCSISNDFVVEWAFMKTNKIFIYIFILLYLLSFYIINSSLLTKGNIKYEIITIGLSFIISVIFYKWDWVHIFGFILLILYIIKLIMNSILLAFAKTNDIDKLKL